MAGFYKPRVLILLAMYNGRAWIKEQIDSIANQYGVTTEIMVSDDNSNDDSKKLLVEIMKINDNVSMISRSKSSGSAGQNFFHLIRNCDFESFDYIAFSDQDDVWLENKLSSGIECLENYSACGYSSSVSAFWESGKEKLICQSKKVRELDFLFEGAGQGCTFILKRDFFSSVQKFCIANKSTTEKFFYHDWLVYILARSTGQNWYFDERSFIRYRQHESNETGAKTNLAAVRSRLKLISNGWFKKQIAIAVHVSKSISPKSSYLNDFDELFKRQDSLSRRLKLVTFFISRGRRKTTDRIVLAAASFLGWL